MATRPLEKFEFDILAFVADHPGRCLREFHQEFGGPRGYIRGTIVKAMDRLHTKGLVSRDESSVLFTLVAVQGRDDLDRKLGESFIKDRLGGRLGPARDRRLGPATIGDRYPPAMLVLAYWCLAMTIPATGPGSAPLPLVPQPEHMEVMAGALDGRGLRASWDAPEARTVGAYLDERLRSHGDAGPGAGDVAKVHLRLVADDESLGAEGYRLTVRRTGVEIEAPRPAGLFYGAQTLLQLIRKDGSIPCVRIVDRPRFAWRGFMLDVSRHFHDKAFVMRMLDLMAMHKLNVFHWHLVDDQGWRIEVKRYPKLTSVAAWRDENGARYGGFYTQDDIREVVAYAAKRFITVVPEIEMPGHSSAALVAYPELGCRPLYGKVPTNWGVFYGVYCPGQDLTYRFLRDVLDEILSLFPSKVVHIGGDEVPKTFWHACPRCQARMKAEGLKDEAELQASFTAQISQYLAARGRRLMGWDEILDGGLARGAIVQSWRGLDGAVAAARLGHEVVVSPGTSTYLSQSNAELGIQRCYSFEPIPPGVTEAQQRLILGGEAPLWGEATPRPIDVELRAFPRLCALAEVFWSPKASRNWRDFAARLQGHLPRLGALGASYYVDPPSLAFSNRLFTDTVQVSLRSGALGGLIVATTDGSDPRPDSPALKGPIRLAATTTVKAATVLGARLMSPIVSETFTRVERQPAEKPGDLHPGLACAVYRGQWTRLPDFGRLKPVRELVASAIDLSPAPSDTDYGLVFAGYVKAPQDGICTFTVASDDGSKLWIGDVLAVDYDGIHAAEEASGEVALQKGWHRFRLEFFQRAEAAKLRVDWRMGAGKRRQLTADALGH